MTISPPPAAPSRQDPATFSDRADAFAAWLVGAVPQFNALAVGSNDSGNFQNIEVTGQITGDAVTQSPTDTTEGRLLTTGAGPAQAFRRGNILGAVSEAAGVPTGAIIERGSNANGSFVRYADGTQMCWFREGIVDHTDSLSGTTRLAGTWTYPASFLDTADDGRPSLQMDVPMHTAANFDGCSREDVQAWGFSNNPGPSDANFSIFFTGGVSTTEASVIAIKLFAIGRWF